MLGAAGYLCSDVQGKETSDCDAERTRAEPGAVWGAEYWLVRADGQGEWMGASHTTTLWTGN